MRRHILPSCVVQSARNRHLPSTGAFESAQLSPSPWISSCGGAVGVRARCKRPDVLGLDSDWSDRLYAAVRSVDGLASFVWFSSSVKTVTFPRESREPGREDAPPRASSSSGLEPHRSHVTADGCARSDQERAMRCSHTAAPRVSSQLASRPCLGGLFRDPCGTLKRGATSK